jgi:UDP-N-acetylglucosamine:LPS N-acetylglucosamine transferase
VKTIDLVYFNAGGGHRAAAQALEQVMLMQGRPWRVRKVNLTEVLDPTALFKRVTGIEPEDIYNKRLASGFTIGLAQELKLLQAGIRLLHNTLVQRLTAHWAATQPDLVVSLIPNFNRALHDALKLARPDAPMVTVLTDMADHPPAFWIEPDLDQHWVCGTHHAEQQALAAGCRRSRVHRVSGMILRPDFHFAPPIDRAAERAAVGLDAHTPTGLVLFGGTGSRVMRRIAERLPDTPLILMCGRNETLAGALRKDAARASAPRVIVGYTPEVARWMQRADFFIGKPGPGSLSEAVHMGLPVIVTRNAMTMPQERWNTQWVLEHGLGRVERSFGHIDRAVTELLAALPTHRAHVAKVHNRALFEVPSVLQRVLGDVAAAQPSPA